MVSATFAAVILASFLACAITTAGIFVISRYESWGLKNAAYFMSFAAGVLISVALLHIIPRSIEINDSAPVYVLIGFLALYLLNRFLNTYICHTYENADLTRGLVPVVGVGLHSFLDGVIYSVTFNVSLFTGLLAAIGMVLHEFPEGIVTFLLLDRSGFSRRQSAGYAFLAAAFSTPLGTLLSFPFIERIDRSTLGVWLAFTAGGLLYVGASHLLPAVEKEDKSYSLLALLAGVLVAVVIILSKR